MTKAEFYAAQRLARDRWLDIASGTDTSIGKIYIDAADQVAEKLKLLEKSGRKKSLTFKSQQELERILRKTGKQIAGSTEETIINSINTQANVNAGPHLKYIDDALGLGAVPKRLINPGVIDEMYAAVNKTLVETTYARLGADGYTFVERIWGFPGDANKLKKIGLPEYWQKDVKNVINTGFAQNRDVLQIAKDITVYAAQGKDALLDVKRYGKLVRGTGKFARRIPKNIDWRALRIARSELYNSLQQTAIIQGQLNPAVIDGARSYDWNLTSGAIHECVCPGIASGSPYRKIDVPDYPHSNCLCYITHRIISRDRFVNDLTDWSNGAGVPYIDQWYTQNYLPFIQ